MFKPVTFLMEYLRRMRSTSSLSAITRSRMSSMNLMNSGCDCLKASRLASSPVSSTVPSARTMRIDCIMRSLLAWVPQLIPLALLMTMPPTIAEFLLAGSGVKARLCRARILSTSLPTSPGCSLM